MPLKIIGTSHIAQQSINEIKSSINDWQPDIIAIELDVQRAAALLHEQRRGITLTQIFQIGLKGYLFAVIGQYVQKKLGRMVGVAPGSDMKTALMEAKKRKLTAAFIDQPIQITLKKFSKELTWRERFRFIGDIFQGIFFPKKQMKKFGFKQFDLTKVPKKEVISTMIKPLKTRYPSVYKTLIQDRNKYMVKRLIKLLRNNPEKKILAIVGAGHEEGMQELLNKVDILR